MDEFLKMLERQFEFMVDDDDNGIDAFAKTDEGYVFMDEDGREFLIEVKAL